MPGLTIWITGLPGSGKSTVADKIREIRPEFIILRMDEMRKIVTPTPTYSESERDIVYRAIVYLAKRLAEAGHCVVIDATGNLRSWRDLARKLIPEYVEIYLRCTVDTCLERERRRSDTHDAPRDIYGKGAEGWPVPGVNAPYEEPVDPELIIDTDREDIGEITTKVGELLRKLRPCVQ